MKLHDLMNVIDCSTPFVIKYLLKDYQYDDPAELTGDYMFYEDIRNKEVTLVWNSRSLYGCIVIEIE